MVEELVSESASNAEGVGGGVMPHQLAVTDTATVIEDAPTLYCVGTEVSHGTPHTCKSDSQSLRSDHAIAPIASHEMACC